MPQLSILVRSSAALAVAVSAFAAQAAEFTFTGQLAHDTDIVRIEFAVDAPSAVRLWTDSWQDGLNFDPTLAVFTAGGSLIAAGDDTPEPADLLPGQGGYDSRIDLEPLAAGRYLLTLTASGNDALGPTLSNGFSLDGSAPIAIADWNQPSYDLDKNDQKNGFWRVHVAGVDGAVAPPVPEPGTLALMLAGLIGMAATISRRR